MKRTNNLCICACGKTTGNLYAIGHDRRFEEALRRADAEGDIVAGALAAALRTAVSAELRRMAWEWHKYRLSPDPINAD